MSRLASGRHAAMTEKIGLRPAAATRHDLALSRPIPGEWIDRGDVALDRLVTHVLVQ